MKNILVLMVCLFASQAYSGTNLHCERETIRGGDAVAYKVDYHCTDRDGYAYVATFKAAGVTLAMNGVSSLLITCSSSDHEKVLGKYYGMRAGAGFVLGAQGGLAVGKKGRTCGIALGNIGVGVVAEVLQMTIKDQFEDYEYDEVIVVE